MSPVAVGAGRGVGVPSQVQLAVATAGVVGYLRFVAHGAVDRSGDRRAGSLHGRGDTSVTLSAGNGLAPVDRTGVLLGVHVKGPSVGRRCNRLVRVAPQTVGVA